MIVVSDTSPLNYLVLIANQDVLPCLFGTVHVPVAVLDEMKHPRAPEAVRDWAAAPPPWVAVQEPSKLDVSLPEKLHRGEVHAISLALELRAAWILIDDWYARQAAKSRDLPVAGTWTILEEAACRELLDIDAAVERLRNTNFRATPAQ